LYKNELCIVPVVEIESLFMFRRLFTRENIFALCLCLIIMLLVIVTTDSSPQWIYQGF